jgi:hypothetical protein
LALARRSQSYLSVAQSNCGSASFCRSRKIRRLSKCTSTCSLALM